MATTHEQLMEDVAAATGVGAAGFARAALEAVLHGLGSLVPRHHRAGVADALPAEVAAELLRPDYDASLGLADLMEQVAADERVSVAFGLEHVVSVLGVLRNHVPHPAFRVLLAELPKDVREIVPEERTASRPPAPPARAGHRIADGRPGASRPLSESQPPGAQVGSVARSGDPHHDTKLSEARGLTQEREHESLAEGKPGPARPVSGSRTED